MVATDADVDPGLHRRAPLANDDGAGADCLPIRPFHAKPLAGAVATVARAAHAFLMCQVTTSLRPPDRGRQCARHRLRYGRTMSEMRTRVRFWRGPGLRR